MKFEILSSFKISDKHPTWIAYLCSTVKNQKMINCFSYQDSLVFFYGQPVCTYPNWSQLTIFWKWFL